MAKILMMTGAIVIVLGLLGFLVLLVKGRTTGEDLSGTAGTESGGYSHHRGGTATVSSAGLGEQ